MNWITWYNVKSGSRTTRAHLVDSFGAERTLCGWSISTLTAPAPRAHPRCEGCLAARAKQRNQARWAQAKPVTFASLPPDDRYEDREHIKIDYEGRID